MSALQLAELDYLYKKNAASTVKTDNATSKILATSETIFTSPIVSSDNVWTESATLELGPSAASSIVTLRTRVKMTSARGVGPNPDIVALTGVAWTSGLTNWVDKKFHIGFAPKFEVASGTNPAPGDYKTIDNSSDYPMIFDYKSGVLTFLVTPYAANGVDLTAKTGTDTTWHVYITGYTYIGGTLADLPENDPIAIGPNAGMTGQTIHSIAIGTNSGQTTQGYDTTSDLFTFFTPGTTTTQILNARKAATADRILISTTVVGGGGGGGAAAFSLIETASDDFFLMGGAGGGAGGYNTNDITILQQSDFDLYKSATVTVGAGGAGGSANTAYQASLNASAPSGGPNNGSIGGAGGTSSVTIGGNTLQATGGGGAQTISSTNKLNRPPYIQPSSVVPGSGGVPNGRDGTVGTTGSSGIGGINSQNRGGGGNGSTKYHGVTGGSGTLYTTAISAYFQNPLYNGSTGAAGYAQIRVTYFQPSIAIGYNAGNYLQGIGSIAIGANSGKHIQGTRSIAIGMNSGMTGQGTIGPLNASHVFQWTTPGTYSINTAGFTGAPFERVDITIIGAGGGSFSGALPPSSASGSGGGGGIQWLSFTNVTGIITLTVGEGIFGGTNLFGGSTVATVVANGTSRTYTATGGQAGRSGFNGLGGTPNGSEARSNPANYTTSIGGSGFEFDPYDDTLPTGVRSGIVDGIGAGSTYALFQNNKGKDGGVLVKLYYKRDEPYNSSAIAIGPDAGKYNQYKDAIAIGNSAGLSNQGLSSICIGRNAGIAADRSVVPAQNSVSIGINSQIPGINSVAIGAGSRGGIILSGTSRGYAAAVGYAAGANENGVGIGREASADGVYSVAIGYNARTQVDGIAIDGESGGVAVGTGSQSSGNGLALGRAAVAYDQQITLNANVNYFIPTKITPGFFVNQVQPSSDLAARNINQLEYNKITKEISYGQTYAYSYGKRSSDSGTTYVLWDAVTEVPVASMAPTMGIWTCRKTGYWKMEATISETGENVKYFYKNYVRISDAVYIYCDNYNVAQFRTMSMIAYLNQGDVIAIGTQGVNYARAGSSFTLHYIGS